MTQKFKFKGKELVLPQPLIPSEVQAMEELI